MKDIQNQPDPRRIPIDRVGVKNLRYPVSVLDRTNGIQHTIASLRMTVNLPHNFRGTHMSRFIEILNAHHRELHIDKIGDILRSMKTRLEAEEAHLEIVFPYFMEKKAPVSGAVSLMEYTGLFSGTLGETEDFILGVDVPVTTLCPCSKELSDDGAHNQRSLVRIRVRYRGFVWMEELIEIAESAASSPLFALLKREDEKSVTERAYQNPKFVEDIVRDVSSRLNADERIAWYLVESENMESIHNHDAYAAIEQDKGRHP
ncbi:MAG TPA: GTP cyclohydrolase I FolE2 [bacterium]|nr:GTP cyclohydrolase I FolE2 [bacterium]